jgi:isopentenyl diphosphate isomerase/L-lactate dehydrogenase-like FMN-dependent dehydrogenase
MTDPTPDRMSPGPRRQMEIYRAGLDGQMPALPVSFEELDRKARSVLEKAAYDYVAGGAGSEETARANRAAFCRWRIVPRFLTDVGRRDLGVDVLGLRLSVPVMLAPIGVLSIVHKEADLAVARAAGSLGVPIILSTASSTTMEDIAALLGDAPRWFQLYWPRDDELAISFLTRAERAGYGAIVVTVDTTLLGWRERDLGNAYLPFVLGEGLANYFSDPVFQKRVGGDPRSNPARSIEYFLGIFSDTSRTWDDFGRLCRATRLPVLVKGILHPDDARKAVDHGAAGVIVSNHGGRQLDGGIATLDALPRVAKAVGDVSTVLFDSGIRRGADVFKAIALGARCVLLGRPYCYGLAIGGEKGVREVLSNLIADIDLTIGLAGCVSFAEVTRDRLLEIPCPDPPGTETN